jgi:hypothetical protein
MFITITVLIHVALWPTASGTSRSSTSTGSSTRYLDLVLLVAS